MLTEDQLVRSGRVTIVITRDRRHAHDRRRRVRVQHALIATSLVALVLMLATVVVLSVGYQSHIAGLRHRLQDTCQQRVPYDKAAHAEGVARTRLYELQIARNPDPVIRQQYADMLAATQRYLAIPVITSCKY